MIVNLLKFEVLVAHQIAKNLSTQHKKEVDPIQYEAVLSVAKALNLYPDLTIKDNPAHLVGRTHARMYVYHSQFDNAHIEYVGNGKGIDLFMLVTGLSGGPFTIRGWIYRHHLMVDQNKHTINYKTGWVVRQDKLKPFTNRVIFDELLDDTRDWQKCETLNFRRKTDGNSEL